MMIQGGKEPMKPVTVVAALLTLVMLAWACTDDADEGGASTTQDPPPAPQVDAPQVDAPQADAPQADAPQADVSEPIDSQCILRGHLRLGGRPASGWRFQLGRSIVEGTQGTFEWRPDAPEPVRWIATDLKGGHARARFVRDLVLAPGVNSLELDLPVGTLELVGLPLPAVFDFLGSAEISVNIALTWEGPDGLQWSATLLSADDGKLLLLDVPAGRVVLRQLLPGDPAKTLEEARVILEIDVPAGQRTHVQFPR